MTKYLPFILLFFVTSLVFSQKDSIKLSNNDVLVGSIEKMDFSILTFSTSYDDSDFKIKWGEVLEIYSSGQFIISVEDGDRFTSDIQSVDGKEKTVKVMAEGVETEYALDEIVFIEPIGSGFFSRLTVDIDLGINITKANNFRQVTSNIDATYLAYKWRARGYYKTVISRQDGAADINRMDAQLGGEYYLPHDWFLQANAIYLSNDEQLLDLRSTYQFGGGYYFIRNNSMFFSAKAGLAYTTENFSNDTPDRNSTEGFLALGFNKYAIGDLSVQTNAALYPSFSQSGRYRVDFNFDMKYDLPLDFYIRLGLNYNYDNKPVEDASDSDYVFTTSFGWEWN
ncbi:DUF481 domain-containing protein [Lutimonas saemankumensis]|uniref:DUF481 domain-containing protein n=1 Tax=Lutimonas saemankumensis TaxID=483016 RepID=UPI001CD6C88B|nr:DUF481 domain-containing protein [Lutimonas saemankumensis]MCA0932131.1 DUF481 domain-containing protein [Lutimonas saemankumensis]